MKSLLINLDRSPQRLVTMQTMFAAIDIPFERVAGVNGKDLPPSVIAQVNEGKKKPITVGKIGSFMSHRKCWQIIADGDDEYGAVFEDDVHLSEHASKFLKTDTWIPADADLVKIETNYRTTRIEKKTMPLSFGGEIARLTGFHSCAGGYILSRAWAKELFDSCPIVPGATSATLFEVHSARNKNKVIYQVIPALCIQHRRIKKSVLKQIVPRDLEQIGSDIGDGGYKNKNATQILRKLKREILRPFHQAYEIPYRFGANLFTDSRYTKIPFERPIKLIKD